MPGEEKALAGIYDICFLIAGIWELFYLSGIDIPVDPFQAGEVSSGECNTTIFGSGAFEDGRRDKRARESGMAKCVLADSRYDGRMPL